MGDVDARMEHFLTLRNVFDEVLAANEIFREKLLFWLKILSENRAQNLLVQHWSS